MSPADDDLLREAVAMNGRLGMKAEPFEETRIVPGQYGRLLTQKKRGVRMEFGTLYFDWETVKTETWPAWFVRTAKTLLPAPPSRERT